MAIVPPCFFPRLSDEEIAAINTAVYDKGMPLLILGGLQGPPSSRPTIHPDALFHPTSILFC